MARAINKLTAREVATLKTPGRHSDGGGLYLRITPAGARSWVFMTANQGKRTEFGLGSAAAISLAVARTLATQMREAVVLGKDPRTVRSPAAEPQARAVPTFGAWADEFIDELAPTFRNAKHREQWSDRLQAQTALLRDKPVGEVDTDDVLDVLRPIWGRTNETASRLRGRIERILDAARAKGHIQPPYENPARWKGHLQHFLKRRKKTDKGHHKAMPYADIPAFMPRLRALGSFSGYALEMTILCATRTTETRAARFKEFDLDNALWTIPKERMKMNIAHTVPLAPRAVHIIRLLTQSINDPDAYIFPGAKYGTPLSDMAMLMCLRGLTGDKTTVHGFRSTFRDWAGDETEHARDVAEMALAHGVGDETEQAYRRASALKKRRALMEDWAAYLDSALT